MVESDTLTCLRNSGFSSYLCGFSAIDSLLGRETGTDIHVLTNADAADLARLFDTLRFPGIDLADAALDSEKYTFYFHCTDPEKTAGQSEQGTPFPVESSSPSFSLLEFYQDCLTRTFFDPRGIYPLLSEFRRGGMDAAKTFEVLSGSLNSGIERNRAVMDAALILARYFPLDRETERRLMQITGKFSNLREGRSPGIEEQRLLLTGLLTSHNPCLGFELLKSSGFIGKFWPELAVLDDVDHSKEFHPEGNVWNHTMETFRYRKAGFRSIHDLVLSLGLLLHDTGKPVAESAGSRRFDGHAELGEFRARIFLERLGFGAALVKDICYLVRNHMIPAALPRLPLFRTGEIMASPLFPVLMELYRCDESSSFKGLDGYYESSAAYQSFLKHRRNPYRSADGKKLNRVQISALIR